MISRTAGSIRKKLSLKAALHDKSAFLHEFVKHPSMVGSICPSGRALTAQLLNGVTLDGDGVVIDLGSGPGPVSECMVRLGIRKDRIIAIEALQEFTAAFKARCPDVPLVIDDAANLAAILDERAPGRKVEAIVSSLPFRALDPEVSERILREVNAVLQERGGRFIQYSYAWWLRYPLRNSGLQPDSASFVFMNLPPARVETYSAQAISENKTAQTPTCALVPSKRLCPSYFRVLRSWPKKGFKLLRTAMVTIRMTTLRVCRQFSKAHPLWK